MPTPRHIVPALAGAAVMASGYGWAAVATPVPTAASDSGVAFHRETLPAAATNQEERPVQPRLEHIRRWISAVGASVGSMDLRGQGVDGDACLTDPRDDTLKVFSVPGSTGTPFPTFELRPDGLRYDRTMAPIGCVPADVDADGRQDVVAYYWGRSPVIFHNEGTPGSAPSAADFVPLELVAPMAVWNTTALNVGDVDGDGRLDVMVGNYFPDGARVLDPSATDDARMEMQQSMGKARNAGTNRLYLNKGTDDEGRPVFEDASAAFPEDSAKSWTLAMGLQDLTDNGVPDMWVANDFGPDQLLVNHSTPGKVRFEEVQGDRTLTTPRSKVLGKDSFKGMGVAFSYDEGADLPNIFVSNITSSWALEESNLFFRPDGEPGDLLDGKVPFHEEATDRGVANSGWSWDVKPVDVTNSGKDAFVQATGMIQGTHKAWSRLQETAMQNDQLLKEPESWFTIEDDHDLSGHEPARLWVPEGDGYRDAGPDAGFSADDVTRGWSVADVNGDDRMDLLVAGQWGDSYVYLNESETENPAVRLRVQHEGEFGPSALVGARVTLSGTDYERTQQLFPANGHSGVAGSTLHFAVPEQARGDLTATVTWTADGRRHTKEFPVGVDTTAPITLEVPS